MPKTEQKNMIPRTHFSFEMGSPWRVDTKTGIKLPDLSQAESVSEVTRFLHQPFTNELGETLPWITAFIEALRVFILERQYPVGRFVDPDGRNDFCPIYSSFAAMLLGELGLQSTTVDVTNYSFFPPSLLNLIDHALALTSLPVAQSKLAGLCINLITNEEPLEDLVERTLDEAELSSLTPLQVLELVKIKNLLRSYKGALASIELILLEDDLRYVKIHFGHEVGAFKVGENICLLDFNQDQNPDPILNLSANYSDLHHQKYGINPLRDSVYIATVDHATRAGYYLQSSELSLRVRLDASKPEPRDLLALQEIFLLMKKGASIWDNSHMPSQTLRLSSTALIESRRKLVNGDQG
jgi:hypothetical protein